MSRRKGKSLTKQEMVKRITEKTKIPSEQAKFVVQVFLSEVLEELARGGRLEFRDFGVFKAVRRRGRSARNPKTGEMLNVEDKVVARFMPARRMRERVARLDPDVVGDGKHSAGKGGGSK